MQREKNYDVLLHGFLNVILIILARYVHQVGFTDLVPFPWFMDAEGHDYRLYEETHAFCHVTHMNLFSMHDRMLQY